MSAPGQQAGRRPRLTGNRCECAACGEPFNGVSGFDRHRVGRHGLDRRCLDVAEMVAHGFARNFAGFWITESEPQRAARGAASNKSGDRVGKPLHDQRSRLREAEILEAQP